MAVDYIKYKNKKLPIKVGYYALKMLQEQHGADMTNIQGNISLYEPLLFYALERGHKIMNKPFTMKMEEMVDILDDHMMDITLLLANAFPITELEKTMGRRLVGE